MQKERTYQLKKSIAIKKSIYIRHSQLKGWFCTRKKPVVQINWLTWYVIKHKLFCGLNFASYDFKNICVKSFSRINRFVIFKMYKIMKSHEFTYAKNFSTEIIFSITKICVNCFTLFSCYWHISYCVKHARIWVFAEPYFPV